MNKGKERRGQRILLRGSSFRRGLPRVTQGVLSWTSWMPPQCLWQPDAGSGFLSKYRLKCPALCTADDLIHNPKREIIRTIGSRFPCTARCSQPLDPFAFILTRGIFHLPFYDLFFTTIGWGWAAGLHVIVIMRTIGVEQLLITQSYDPLKQILINHKTYVFLLNSRDKAWKQMEELHTQIKFDGAFKNKLSLAGLSCVN